MRGPEVVRRIALASVIVAAGGCPQGPRYPASWQARTPDGGGAREVDPAREPDPIAIRSPEAESMHAWLLAIGSAEHAVVLGDPAAAREEGRALAERLRGSVPPGAWVAIVAEIAREADALAHADSLESASASVARMAAHCGGCHASLGVQPPLPTLASMPTRRAARDPKMTMRWHGWAADRMWEGLVGPSEERWVRGTATFVALPGCEDAPSAPTGEAAERCHHTRALAQRGHVATTTEDRAAIFGSLLATCAGCHVASATPVVVPPRT